MTDSVHTEIDKLQWEVRKLQAETTELLRPFWHRSGFWMSTFSVGAAIIGILVQSYFSSLDARKAEIMRAEAELSTKLATQQRDEVEKDMKEKQSQVNELTRVTKELETLRASKERELLTVSAIVQNLKEEKLDRKEQLSKLEASLRTLSNQQSQSAVLTKDQFNLLGGLSKK